MLGAGPGNFDPNANYNLSNPFASGISDPSEQASVFGSGGGGQSGAGASAGGGGSSSTSGAFGFNPVQSGLGVWEAIKGYQGLKNLENQPMPNYSLAPGLQDYFNQTKVQSQYGFDPSQTAAFKQGVSQQQNTGYRQGIELGGGNLAQALSVGLSAQNLGAQNQFATENAQLKSQHLQQYGQAAGELQSEQNLATQADIARRNQLEQAYGGALQTGLKNITSGFTFQGLGGGSSGGGASGAIGGLSSLL
jgi:hypothetical protein